MKKYILAVFVYFLIISNVTITHAATTPQIKITSALESGDMEVDVEVTNYNQDMEGFLQIEVGDEMDYGFVDQSVFFSVTELVKGMEVNIYYIDADDKKTLLKKATVGDVVLPIIKLTDPLTTKSETLEYTITNHVPRFDEGEILLKVDKEDVYQEAIVGKTGAVGLSEVFESGTQVELYYVNRHGVEFYLMTTTVGGKDEPSSKNTLTVPKVTDQMKTFKVKYEKNSVVTLTNGTKTYTGKELENGQYQFTIPAQKAGTALTVTATNSTGEEKTKKIVVISASVNGSTKLTVPSVTNRTKVFKVKYEKDSVVTLKSGKKTYKGKELGNGQYQFTIPTQKIGTTLTVNATNSASKKQTKKIIVKLRSASTLSMNKVTVISKTVTGVTRNAETKDQVKVIIGKKIYKGIVSDNKYTIKIPKQKAGTTIKVQMIDAAGNILYTIVRKVGY